MDCKWLGLMSSHIGVNLYATICCFLSLDLTTSHMAWENFHDCELLWIACLHFSILICRIHTSAVKCFTVVNSIGLEFCTVLGSDDFTPLVGTYLQLWTAPNSMSALSHFGLSYSHRCCELFHHYEQRWLGILHRIGVWRLHTMGGNVSTIVKISE